ncbi:hypothetical protein B1B04_13685 [Lysinibacillus sp. KCTC 33748]|uniref:DUF6241 domain-containing protein n=1 Tax=unclassified Lysinibacillus TaxID=2636778 RepID=UPI0009A83442|nr:MULTISPECIES: DUF6241 domain-containing protein [unclassified Lysinibacillus]OXS73011.1 hypothetical protein B1B04_13685 [Lysinibacillus sp. KCTC 33748]SKB85946.1 hypothetical protein SAMN06295926_11054 [Lysinibacillus sp. AC-3]
MKRMHVLGMVVLTALLSVSGTFLIMKKNDESENSKSAESDLTSGQSISKEHVKEEFVSTVDTNFGWENTTYSKKIDEWKSGDEPFIDNLMQEVIQEMSHQKIIADEKESSIMITPKRIELLLQMVEENKDGYEHSNKYLDILNRWKQGDFKSVDKDHNDMWFIQGTKEGGIATGISTKEQEKDYIFQVFSIPIEKQS